MFFELVDNYLLKRKNVNIIDLVDLQKRRKVAIFSFFMGGLVTFSVVPKMFFSHTVTFPDFLALFISGGSSRLAVEC